MAETVMEVCFSVSCHISIFVVANGMGVCVVANVVGNCVVYINNDYIIL